MHNQNVYISTIKIIKFFRIVIQGYSKAATEHVQFYHTSKSKI